MRLNKLSIKDKKIFVKYLNSCQHELSVYAFENIYIWGDLFDIQWLVIEDNLCTFFKDKIGCFMYIPPQGRTVKPEVVQEAFRIMDNFNQHKEISRIENVEAKDLPIYQNLGYVCTEKYPEYLCRRQNLARLSGNKFKSKRASFNYFNRHYKFEYLPYSLRYRDNCLKLYDDWMGERKTQNQDPVYQGMIEDSRNCLRILLNNYQDLNVMGKVIKIEDRIKAFTFGFKLNQDIFCILYEITDLSIKGLAQFIFREFCQQLSDYKYINIMDDSGLENLKKVKLSYYPTRLIPAYIVKKRSIGDTLPMPNVMSLCSVTSASRSYTSKSNYIRD